MISRHGLDRHRQLTPLRPLTDRSDVWFMVTEYTSATRVIGTECKKCRCTPYIRGHLITQSPVRIGNQDRITVGVLTSSLLEGTMS